MKDPYKVLGVPRNADESTIRKQYKKLARKLHPDVNKSEGAETRFKEVNQAYAILGDEEKRKLYDEFGEASLASGFDPEQARAWKNMGGRGAPGGAPFGGGSQGAGFEDLFSGIFSGGGPGGGQQVHFEDLFGGGGGPGGGGGRRGRRARSPFGDMFGGAPGGAGPWASERPRPRKGRDLETEARIHLLTAIRGGKVLLTVQPPPGPGAPAQPRKLRVDIPAGVREGQVIRLRGQGGPGPGGTESGDLLIQVTIEPHPRIRRSGDDLEMDLPVTIGEAMNGASVEVPTPDGTLKVKVPAGSRNGSRLRLKSRGVPRKKGGRGDLFLVVRPTPPSDPSEEARALARKLDSAYKEDVRAGLTL